MTGVTYGTYSKYHEISSYTTSSSSFTVPGTIVCVIELGDDGASFGGVYFNLHWYVGHGYFYGQNTNQSASYTSYTKTSGTLSPGGNGRYYTISSDRKTLTAGFAANSSFTHAFIIGYI